MYAIPFQRFNPLTPGSWNSPNNDIPPDEPLCGLLGVLCTKDASRKFSHRAAYERAVARREG